MIKKLYSFLYACVPSLLVFIAVVTTLFCMLLTGRYDTTIYTMNEIYFDMLFKAIIVTSITLIAVPYLYWRQIENFKSCDKR